MLKHQRSPLFGSVYDFVVTVIITSVAAVFLLVIGVFSLVRFLLRKVDDEINQGAHLKVKRGYEDGGGH